MNETFDRIDNTLDRIIEKLDRMDKQLLEILEILEESNKKSSLK